MKIKILLLFIILLLVPGKQTFSARPKRPKSCAPKILLPGQSKAVKCKKARKMKNAYF